LLQCSVIRLIFPKKMHDLRRKFSKAYLSVGYSKYLNCEFVAWISRSFFNFLFIYWCCSWGKTMAFEWFNKNYKGLKIGISTVCVSQILASWIRQWWYDIKREPIFATVTPASKMELASKVVKIFELIILIL
jgi:hypothetical protein